MPKGSLSLDVTIFTKLDCSHCLRAKQLLDQCKIPYKEIDASETNPDNGALSIYMSGQKTLPQIFFGDYPIGGADDLDRLVRNGALDQIEGWSKNAAPIEAIQFPDVDKELLDAIYDEKMAEHIEFIDGTKSAHPEDLPLLHFYKVFFGWWPNCYGYLYQYPEGYRSFLYTTLMSVAGGPVNQLLGDELQHALAFSTSQAQGCGYCQVHTAAVGSDVNAAHEINRLAVKDETETRFTPFEQALIELAGKASTNDVSQELLERIRALNSEQADDYIVAAGKIASIFGFLNTFNDLTSVDIEPGWNSEVQEVFEIDLGKHIPDENASGNPDNLNFEIPTGPLSFMDMLEKYDGRAEGDYAAYLTRKLGVAPNWEHAWAAPLRARHAAMYVELIGQDGPSPKVSAELKHLMCRVSAIVRGHDYLASLEGYLAYNAAGKTERAVARVAECYRAALGKSDEGLFTEQEVAALRLAGAAAQIPLVTLRKMTTPLMDHYDQAEIVQLFVVCAVAASLQRWCAVVKPRIEPEVSEFLEQHGMLASADAYKLGYRTDLVSVTA